MSKLDMQSLRLKELSSIENEIREEGFEWIAGLDEAGRGPLAGPVVAAACILPQDIFFYGIDDSKKLSSQKRAELYELLINHPKVYCGVGVVEACQIDEINIHKAVLEAMKQAVFYLKKAPDFLLVDGLYVPDSKTPSAAIVEGDQKSQAIAAASIVAKVTRDHIMLGYHQLFPCYGFDKHKGYGTKEHLEAIKTYGMCRIHRKSFGLLKKEWK